MKKLINSSILFLFFLLLFNCNDDSIDRGVWSIPSAEVFDGGPGKDGIPSVDSPVFAGIADITFLSDQDLVVGVVTDDEVKAYILFWIGTK